MSDPMMGQEQLPPPGGDKAFKDQLSMQRPDDVSAMAQMGMIDPNMSIRDFFGQFGVNVDGPITQLAELAEKQEANADPLNKMKSMAGSPAPTAPQSPQGMPSGPEPSGNPMDQLMQ